jgi:ElaB/YqjD/DUF883 family membrane-anchored ribosome-binding protein
MGSQGQSTGSGMKDELSALLEDLLELASSATGINKEKLADIKQGLHERVDQLGGEAKDAASDAASAIRDKASETFEQVDSYAHAKPWNLVIAAGLVGLVVGLLVARK